MMTAGKVASRDEEWRQPQCKRSPSRRRDHYAIIRASVDASAESVAFIGAGNMAEAIVNGLSGCGVVNREKIIVSTRNVKRREDWAKTGVVVKEDNVSAAKSADVVFLAVKPYGIVDLIKELKESIDGKSKLFISIAAGVTLSTMESAWEGQRFVRVMPNTPSLVGVGASVYALGKHASSKDSQTVQRLLSAVGIATEIPEGSIDSATGISGSGPAYIYILIEALTDAGVYQGLKRDIARQLATQTVLGTAKMVKELEDLHPAQLRNAVESPGGCTIYAVRALEKGNLRSAIYDAVDAACKRAKELS